MTYVHQIKIGFDHIRLKICYIMCLIYAICVIFMYVITFVTPATNVIPDKEVLQCYIVSLRGHISDYGSVLSSVLEVFGLAS